MVVKAHHPLFVVVSQSAPEGGLVVCMGVGVVGGELYVVGGYDGDEYLKSVEKYCVSSNIWSRVRDMNCGKVGAAVVACGGRLYVLGGWDGCKYLSSVEVYDPAQDTWTMLPAGMATARFLAGAVVIDRPT